MYWITMFEVDTWHTTNIVPLGDFRTRQEVELVLDILLQAKELEFSQYIEGDCTFSLWYKGELIKRIKLECRDSELS